jgi:hypothetical protein
MNRVTDFSSWIFEAMHGPSSAESLAAGKRGERAVAEFKRRLFREWPLAKAYADWELIACDPLFDEPVPLRISQLRVNNSPLYGMPDYAFLNKRTATVLVIEIKTRKLPLGWTLESEPSDGWPNLRAQLWAYGHIDEFRDIATTILLVGEIWRESYDGSRRTYEPLNTYRWNLRDEHFYSQNQELFEIYQRWCE